jgi:hypothetical protein
MASVIVTKPGTKGRPNFGALNRRGGVNGAPIGGKFILPVEFDSVKFASAFYTEGAEARSMQTEQPVVGTAYFAEGWKVWKFPKEIPEGFPNEGDPHPNAGEPHKVVSASSKSKEAFVLMYRPKEVQEQVNQCYGLLSLEQMTAEVKGETLSVEEANGDKGMLTADRLDKAYREPDAIEENAEVGKDTAINQFEPEGFVIKKKVKKIKN